MNPLDQSTICAVATPPGRGGILVIRVSGSRAWEMVRTLCPGWNSKPESHRALFFKLKHPVTGALLDEAVLTFFEKGRSFTGEETVEISCHGNPVVGEQVIQALVEQGARLAMPGEFTARAFFNGRLDLVQAESVLSVIESQSGLEARNALRQLEGGLSGELHELRSQLLHWLAHIEAGIDFTEEGLDLIDRKKMQTEIESAQRGLNDLLSSYQVGRILREGFRVVFVGSPNVGKSSLLNAVLGEDRSIVTEIPGTTRDVVEGWTTAAGVRVSWVDTAGLRVTEDRVESEGIARARKSLDKADLVFFVLNQRAEASDLAELAELRHAGRDLVVVWNKVDLGAPAHSLENFPQVRVSALDTKAAKKTLVGEVEKRLQGRGGFDGLVVSNARHFESLQKVRAGMSEALGMLGRGESLELVAMPLKEGLIEVQSLLGEHYDEQIIDQIFREFCLGK